MTNAKNEAITKLTLIYAGSRQLPAGQLADEWLVTSLFPWFNGDWETVNSQIGYKTQDGNYYACERLDSGCIYEGLGQSPWLRCVEDDEIEYMI